MLLKDGKDLYLIKENDIIYLRENKLFCLKRNNFSFSFFYSII